MSEYVNTLLPSTVSSLFSLREKEELHEDAIVRFHELMNPNRRASRYYVTREGVRRKNGIFSSCDQHRSKLHTPSIGA